MKIEFVRDLMASYMVIEQESEHTLWERKMIENCKAETLLFAKEVQQDGKTQFWYIISGKQALDVILESTPLTYEMLCRIMIGIYEALRDTENYLLDVNGLLLDAQSIFFDGEKQRMVLCYCSGNRVTIMEAFRKFMEELLPLLDHKDEAAVELAYRLYEQTVKMDFCIEQLCELVCIQYETDEVAETADEVETSVLQTEKTDLKDENIMPQNRNIIGILIQKIAENTYKVKDKMKAKWKKPEKTQIMVFEPEDEAETEKEKGRPTVLLKELRNEPEGVLRYEGDTPGILDIYIGKTPFGIGSDSACDGVVLGEAISRHHAKITKTENIYFIEDLNSKNGTYVGGELLNYKTKMSLAKNESIILANEKFRFI